MDKNNSSLQTKEEKKENKLCRACSDFKSWVNNKRASMFSSFVSENMTNNQEQINQHASRDDCPLDKDNLGHRTWSFLHTMAAYFPDEPSTQQQKEMTLFMKLFSKYYPCDHCAKDFRKEITEVPPDTSSRQAFSLWLCKMHNIVNKKLGKEEFDCTLVDERWRDGWKSGVCDE